MSNNRAWYSIHHPVCTSVGWKNVPVNRLKIDTVPHNALHIVFQNLIFKNQVHKILTLNEKVLKPHIITDIRWYLENNTNEETYDERAIDLEKYAKYEARFKNQIRKLIIW